MNDERKITISERVDAAIAQLRLIRSRVKKNLQIDPSEISMVQEIFDSLRHNCEMHNAGVPVPSGATTLHKQKG